MFANQIVKAERYICTTVRTQLDHFFTQSRSWLRDNRNKTQTSSDRLRIGNNHKPQSDPLKDLPSYSWLSNKVDNSSKSADFDSAFKNTGDFTSTLNEFTAKFNTTGISDDLSRALQSARNLLATLTSRGVLNGSLSMRSFKSSRMLRFVFSTLAVNTRLDIPVISKIFQTIVGLDLKLFNLTAILIAIPFYYSSQTFNGPIFTAVHTTHGFKLY
ncbi:hypothetical protein BJV74DRAFT_888170 [Russula compacta]|nr:hypothetical protein BJV74DRAFT_888170 [Russula compacta]